MGAGDGAWTRSSGKGVDEPGLEESLHSWAGQEDLELVLSRAEMGRGVGVPLMASPSLA